MSVRIGLAIAVALQTLALFAMVGMKQWTLSTGTPVVLEMRPVDPRSLFRGDYVRLSYAINRLTADLPGMPEQIQRRETVYVTLRKDGTFWKPVSVHTAWPKIAAGDVVIKGEAQYGVSKKRKTQLLSVRYGIEEYFVPEGEGREIERLRSGEKVTTLIAVDRFGNAGIKAIMIDDKVRYEEKLF